MWLRSSALVPLLPLVLLVAAPAYAQQETLLARGNWTRALAGGWGHAWKYGVPGYGKTTSDVELVAFQPQLGRFLTSRLEMFGEGTLHLYYRPTLDVSAGAAGLGGRYHFSNNQAWTPYVTMAAGLIWTSLEVAELDRTFNFQVQYGLGFRQVTTRGPGLMLELRGHHISNGGTKGENRGLNTLLVVVGVHWVLR